MEPAAEPAAGPAQAPSSPVPPEVISGFRYHAAYARNYELGTLQRIRGFSDLTDRLGDVVGAFHPGAGWGDAVEGARALVESIPAKSAEVRARATVELDRYGAQIDGAEALIEKPDLTNDEVQTAHFDVARAAGAFMGLDETLAERAEAIVAELMTLGRMGIQAEDNEFATQVGAVADAAREYAQAEPVVPPNFAARVPES